MWHILNLGSKMTFDKKKKEIYNWENKSWNFSIESKCFFFLKVPLQGDDLGL